MNAYDFSVGNKIDIAGRSILLHFCDDFTRNFYAKLKIEQPPNFETSSDNFENVVLKSFEPKLNCGLNSYHNNGKVPSQKKFFENDRKVLRFYAKMNEDSFVIHFYISDDSIEASKEKKMIDILNLIKSFTFFQKLTKFNKYFKS